MCKVHNQIGSLTAIRNHLRRRNVSGFSSVKELVDFQNRYSDLRRQITLDHTLFIKREREELISQTTAIEEILATRRNEVSEQLNSELNTLAQQKSDLARQKGNVIKKIFNYFKWKKIGQTIRELEGSYGSRIFHATRSDVGVLERKTERLQLINSDFSRAVNESSFSQLRDLERTKAIIDEINTSIYGAKGEQQVVKALEGLSDDYILINDFSCSFVPPIYNRQERDYIKSVQIDHLLISPSGIFLIETKNWSTDSLKSLDLRSPVEQVRRTSFALFKLLADKMKGALDQHHWGDRKIPIRNLIVFINHKPKEEFQFVKILTLKELRNYIEFFEPCLTVREAQVIADYLLHLIG